MTTSESWRVVPRLPEYEASSFGRVMRTPYRAEMPHGGYRTYGGQPRYGDLEDGRYHIIFKGHCYKVHRLVCEAFNGPKPFDGAVVMRLDEDETNNRPENLAWGTQKENLNAPGFIAYCKGRTGENNPRTKGCR